MEVTMKRLFRRLGLAQLSLASLFALATSACLAQAPEPPSASSQAALKRALKLPLPERDAVLKEHLSPLEYYVTQEQGTERPFQNRYWDHKGVGIYVDVISGEPLFSSRHKYRSGTGWPSFDRPIKAEQVKERADHSHGVVRVEVTSASSGAHLGHVFEDGPASTGRRYCMNAAALRFIPLERLDEEGYGAWIKLAGLAGERSVKPTSKSEAPSGAPSVAPARAPAQGSGG